MCASWIFDKMLSSRLRIGNYTTLWNGWTTLNYPDCPGKCLVWDWQDDICCPCQKMNWYPDWKSKSTKRCSARYYDDSLYIELVINSKSLQAVEILKKQLYWLKREDCNITENIDESEIPHEFLCPITHEIMKEPVQCSGKNIA